MASQSTGIQQLLGAEKRAAEKIAAARKRKALRLKQAKDEAHAEIEKYRMEREHEYKKNEAMVMGSRGDMEAKIEQATRARIHEQDSNMKQNKEIGMKRLLGLVYEIKPVIHCNYRASS